jgi:hypothetical protein
MRIRIQDSQINTDPNPPKQWINKSKLSLIYSSGISQIKKALLLSPVITMGTIWFESRYRNKTDATDLNTGA